MPALMIQGCTSDAGKSTLVAALCRLLHRQGYSVAPFKPQNMALSAAVTVDGGEIGRAQATQALACGLAPHSDMNPVLLKPTSDRKAQVIIQGKAIGHLDALDYHAYKATAKAAVLESWQRLSHQYPICLVEGAGSPAEINLRENDIANMGFAEAVDIPVILIADIDRGGVFAHIIGTLACLSESEQARIKGFVINRFRGDVSLLQSGLDWLEAKTGKPVLGVLPYLHDLKLDEEDAVRRPNQPQTAQLKIRILRLAHISNHSDFTPLLKDSRLDVDYLPLDTPAVNADVLIIPGSKAVMNDLTQLNEHDWRNKLLRHLRYGGKVLAICGGFQMLGRQLLDPKKIEGDRPTMAGLAVFDFTTRWQSDKILQQRTGKLWTGESITGYEMHQGISSGNGLTQKPFATFDDGSTDGAISDDGKIIGTYLHGLFDHPEAYQALTQWMGLNLNDACPTQSHEQQQLAELDRLADMLEQHVDMTRILSIIDAHKPCA
jgi:adenosylcobyric acid synthase